MTVRVRRRGLALLALLAGASLLRSSLAISAPRPHDSRTVTLRLAQNVGVAPRDVWAVESDPVKNWTQAEAQLALVRPQSPDGLALLALAVKVGRQRPRVVLTNAVTAADLAEALGLDLSKTDVVKPGRDAVLWGGMRLLVIRIRKDVESSTVTLPFETLIRYSSDLDPGHVKVLTAGKTGSAVWTWQVTYRNGVEVSRVLLSENVLVDPVAQVLQEGKSTGAHGVQVGQASWYDFCPIDGNYAAHLTLPFGTVVTVKNLDNGDTITVVINDRGPYGVPGRIIDLCDAAFAQIAPLSQGVANVQISW